MKAAFYTLGCKVNQYETQILKQYFAASAFDIVAPEDDADVYVINSCTVTAAGDKKTRQMIRKFRRQNKNAVVALTGCMPQAFPAEAAKLLDADIISGSYNRAQLIQNVKRVLATGERIIDITPHEKNLAFEEMKLEGFGDRTRAFLKIQDGCERYCAYCIIPTARGNWRSKPIDDVCEEAANLAQAGFREIVLVGINLSCYGIENGLKLTDLIAEISKIAGIERIRLGSLEPELLSLGELEKLAAIPQFCPQFHLSLQSGCDNTLSDMNRHYNSSEYAEIVDNIRGLFDNPAITTDIMVGFPGESDKDFYDSLAFVERMGFARSHVFIYSQRKGTKAAEMQNQVASGLKLERSKRMVALTDRLSRDFLEGQIGRRAEVLFEGKESGEIYEGYSKNYSKIRVKSKENISKNTKIVEIESLVGEICQGVLI